MVVSEAAIYLAMAGRGTVFFMKKTLTNFLAVAKEWQCIAGYSKRKVLDKTGKQSVAVVEYDVEVPESFGLKEKRLLFFSDLHFGSVTLNPYAFRKVLHEIKPSWVVFGGDLITYACFQDEAFEFLEEVFEPFSDTAKVAVLGNWDRRRIRWYPNEKLLKAYRQIGFHLLVNERVELGGINFFGMDEPRIGSPYFNVKLLEEDKLNCIASHSVDPVVDAMPKNNFSGKQLFLCGHSHGGQIRLPFFGALITSTKYWKLFEYGHYHLPRKNIDLIASSGVGRTRLPFRLFCEPELVVINFKK